MDILNELERILVTGDITTVFQPIVSLVDGTVLGYEALSRGPKDSPLQYPNDLFKTADEYNKSWELESLCRIKALEKSRTLGKDKLLFLNVDPLIFKDEKFKKGFTKEFLDKLNISPNSIIFEITEKTAIEDYCSFKTALDNYREQGYKIAIDDTGSGYSGLKTLSETKPHYIKIDMDLIRDIHVDTFKQALIKALVTFAKTTNMQVIAEGIECEEELSTLISLNVDAGQGYFLQRPSGTFLDINNAIKNIIIKHDKLKNNKFNYSNNYVGDICTFEKAFPPTISCKEVQEYVNNSTAKGVCIVEDGIPIGSIMKSSLDSMMAAQYGFSVFSKRPISIVMDHTPLIVDYYTPVIEVSKAAMSRIDSKTYDCVIVTKDSKYYGLVTIKKLLEFTTELERNYAKELNPLTGLPGNILIEKVLSDLLCNDHKCCILYLDLDNFKAYNDTYGFENGDKILKFTAELIQKSLRKHFPYNSFIGHIGGDDYICIVESTLDRCDIFCNILLEKFDENIVNFFNESDIDRGFIESTDRNGNITFFNITSLSIAGLYGSFSTFSNSHTIAQLASKIKKEAKKIKGSSKIIKNIEEITEMYA